MIHLVCERCGTVYEADPRRWRCDCGGPLSLDAVPPFVPAMVDRRAEGLWRYEKALPVDAADRVSLGEGRTPLIPILFDGRTLLVKQEQLFSTGSYKDRGAAVLMTYLHARGVRHVVEDSSGNAGTAIAAYAAQAGIVCDIYVPADTSSAKTFQIEAYGATLHRIPGSREAAAAAAREAAGTAVYASHVYNPWFLQGTKTFAYETAEQLGWRAPDTLVLPVGNGTLLLGAFIGFHELVQAGVVAHMPRIIAVQAAACDPLAAAFEAGAQELQCLSAGHTIAEGIAIAAPVRGSEILTAVRATQGRFVTVSEQEIAGSLRECCRRGWLIEPTSAAVIAGARRYAAGMNPGEVVVTVFTGHGLKTPGTIAEILAT